MKAASQIAQEPLDGLEVIQGCAQNGRPTPIRNPPRSGGSPLTNDAIVTMNQTHWLRVPVGKLHTDRYVPLHPTLIDLHRTWRQWAGPDDTGRLISNQGRVLNRYSVARTVAACARIAGIGHVHPHQLRHTLATQSINNGMSLEAIAAMLGHRSMRMTLVYARIADRTVADQYFAAADKVDQLYTTHLTTSPA